MDRSHQLPPQCLKRSKWCLLVLDSNEGHCIVPGFSECSPQLAQIERREFFFRHDKKKVKAPGGCDRALVKPLPSFPRPRIYLHNPPCLCHQQRAGSETTASTVRFLRDLHHPIEEYIKTRSERARQHQATSSCRQILSPSRIIMCSNKSNIEFMRG